MNSTVRYCLILISLCGIYTCKSQDILRKADSLFTMGDYRQSALAYEWAVYSGANPQIRYKAINGRVQSLKNLGYFDEASEYIDKQFAIDLPDSLRAELYYESLLVNFLSSNYSEVWSRYLMGKSILQDSEYKADASLLACMSQLKSDSWDKVSPLAEVFIRDISPTGQADSLIECFHKLFNPLESPKMKSPKTARIMSMIIPGSGQIYAGYTLDGLTSFGLHILALAGAGFSFYHGLYITGWIGGFGILQKLYFGGNHRAADLCEQKNRLNKESFIQPAISFLISLPELYK